MGRLVARHRGVAVDTATPPWFVETYQREYPGLLALATLMTGSPAMAEDVVQEAFAAMLHRPDVREPGAYVRRSVVNGSIGTLRRLTRESDATPADHPIDADSTLDVVDAMMLRAALQTLPQRQRAAVLMRVTLGWSEQETATALECAPGTVGSLLHRGLAALRVHLSTAQVTQPAGRHEEHR